MRDFACRIHKYIYQVDIYDWSKKCSILQEIQRMATGFEYLQLFVLFILLYYIRNLFTHAKEVS